MPSWNHCSCRPFLCLKVLVLKYKKCYKLGNHSIFHTSIHLHDLAYQNCTVAHIPKMIANRLMNVRNGNNLYYDHNKDSVQKISLQYLLTPRRINWPLCSCTSYSLKGKNMQYKYWTWCASYWLIKMVIRWQGFGWWCEVQNCMT